MINEPYTLEDALFDLAVAKELLQTTFDGERHNFLGPVVAHLDRLHTRLDKLATSQVHARPTVRSAT